MRLLKKRNDFQPYSSLPEMEVQMGKQQGKEGRKQQGFSYRYSNFLLQPKLMLVWLICEYK